MVLPSLSPRLDNWILTVPSRQYTMSGAVKDSMICGRYLALSGITAPSVDPQRGKLEQLCWAAVWHARWAVEALPSEKPDGIQRGLFF